MSTTTQTPTPAPAADRPAWHALRADVVLQAEGAETFVIWTGVSILTLILATVLGPLQAFLKTTSLDGRQWLICTGVALTIVVVAEIRKAITRRRVTTARDSRPNLDTLRGG